MVDGTQTLWSYFVNVYFLNAGNISHREVLCHFQRGSFGLQLKNQYLNTWNMQYNMKNKLVENRCNFPIIFLFSIFSIISDLVQRESPYVLRSINGGENKNGYSIFFPKLSYISYICKLIILFGKSQILLTSFYHFQIFAQNATLFLRLSWILLFKTVPQHPMAWLPMFLSFSFLHYFSPLSIFVYFPNLLVYYYLSLLTIISVIIHWFRYQLGTLH